MKALLRIAVGLIFMASGFVKAVDPVGFSFKLEEYFSPAVFNMAFLERFSLPIAVFISVLEFLLGVLLVLKLKLRAVLAALILLCVFFAFLTFYSAYFNVVTDCGCFGDAVKFTPWQSFTKDIILLLALLVLWKIYQNQFDDSKSFKIKFAAAGLLLLAMVFFTFKGIVSEPLIDFRDYKVGTDLNVERSKIAANPSEYKTVYILKNKNTGEEKRVGQDAYLNDKTLWQDGSPWMIQSGKTTTELVKQGYKSEISKFHLEDKNGKDVTTQILNAENVVLLFSYKPTDLNAETLTKAENEVRGNPLVYGVSTGKNTFAKIPNLTMDGTAIKTIARSNPFVMVLDRGKIIEKKALKDFLNN